eukprot:3048692-Prymnesium_polylepis.1
MVKSEDQRKVRPVLAHPAHTASTLARGSHARAGASRPRRVATACLPALGTPRRARPAAPRLHGRASACGRHVRP